jgi:hypothetical protein
MLDKPEMVFLGKLQMDVGYEDLPIFLFPFLGGCMGL